MGNISVIPKKDCLGCGACYSNCHYQAISIESDDYGFYYPVINNSQCINCGKCILACPLKNKVVYGTYSTVYAISIKDKKKKENSSSGGAFVWLAESIIANGGVVYGAAFDPIGRIVKHIRVDSFDQIVQLQNSKYVESNIGDCFKEAKCDLEAGKAVLFSGTPCQIAGLYSFVGREWRELYTCDLMCYGTPSPLVLSKYLEETIGLEKISYMNMRDKTNGWVSYSMKLVTDKKIYIRSKNKDLYQRGFQTHIFYRESCYDCPYRRKERVGDITLGDFWDFKESFKKGSIINDNTGISFVMINTNKGMALFNNSNKKTIYSEIRSVEENENNFGFSKELCITKDRDLFFERLQENQYSVAISPYLKEVKTEKPSFIRKIYRVLKKYYWFRKVMNKVGRVV